jgi:hypothetical protein
VLWTAFVATIAVWLLSHRGPYTFASFAWLVLMLGLIAVSFKILSQRVATQ